MGWVGYCVLNKVLSLLENNKDMGFQVPSIQGQVAAQIRFALTGTVTMTGVGQTLNATFAAQPNLAWGIGSRVRVVSVGDPGGWYMEGIVTVVTPGNVGFAMVVDVSVGSGSKSDVVVGLTGESGYGLNSVVVALSTTSNSIGTGIKTFTYSAISNLGWAIGTMLMAYNSVGNYMVGTVSTVSSTQVAINIDYIVGSGTYASWNISLSGDRGDVGPVYSTSLVAAPANAATLTLARANETFITTSLTNSNSFVIGLATPLSGSLNEYIVSFKTGASAPALTQPVGIKWRGGAPTIAATENWTIVYQNIEVSSGVYEIWASAIKAV